jgi:hypothetical protein
MHGKTLRLKFKANEDVTIAEGSGEAMGEFELDSGSTPSTSGTQGVCMISDRACLPLSVRGVVDIDLSGMVCLSKDPYESCPRERRGHYDIYMDSGPGLR